MTDVPTDITRILRRPGDPDTEQLHLGIHRTCELLRASAARSCFNRALG